MPRNDHYVAETYLKHFLGANGLFYVYRKSDGRAFPSKPTDICHELDGDLIPDFLNEPTLLGQYRSIFEPSWNPAIKHLENDCITSASKMAIAGYWANLLLFTPARRRIDVAVHDRAVVQHLSSRHSLLGEIGKSDLELSDVVDALSSGQFFIKTEPEAMRAMRVRHVVRLAWVLFNSDWLVMQNETGVGFVTSDNPAAFHDPGILQTTQKSLLRLLPVTPSICILCHPRRPKRMDPDFSQAPFGRVDFKCIRIRGVRHINRAVVQCAENLVITPGPNSAIQALTAKYARYRIDVEFIEKREPNGFLFGYRDRVREIKSEAKL